MQWSDREPLSDSELDSLLREWKVDPPSERFEGMKFRDRNWLRTRRVWIPAACLACGALFIATLVTTRPPQQQRATWEEAAGFTPIPYTLPLGAGERERVVRMSMSVAALAATGLRIPAADPTTVLTADVLVGDDGRARAVRVVNAISGGME